MLFISLPLDVAIRIIYKVVLNPAVVINRTYLVLQTEFLHIDFKSFSPFNTGYNFVWNIYLLIHKKKIKKNGHHNDGFISRLKN